MCNNSMISMNILLLYYFFIVAIVTYDLLTILLHLELEGMKESNNFNSNTKEHEKK
jgi:hypothetical protein